MLYSESCLVQVPTQLAPSLHESNDGYVCTIQKRSIELLCQRTKNQIFNLTSFSAFDISLKYDGDIQVTYDLIRFSSVVCLQCEMIAVLSVLEMVAAARCEERGISSGPGRLRLSRVLRPHLSVNTSTYTLCTALQQPVCNVVVLVKSIPEWQRRSVKITNAMACSLLAFQSTLHIHAQCLHFSIIEATIPLSSLTVL
jgi:hypothetical protein